MNNMFQSKYGLKQLVNWSMAIPEVNPCTILGVIFMADGEVSYHLKLNGVPGGQRCAIPEEELTAI